jgi:hypothetical protein
MNLSEGLFFRGKMTTENPIHHELIQHTRPIVLECIDFRAVQVAEEWLAGNSLRRGEYHLYASAGASGNPRGFLAAVKRHHHDMALVADHETCGFYKQNGDDSHEKHHHNLETLGESVSEQNPNMDYLYTLLPINDTRHTSKATAIMLGQPEIVKLALEKLENLGLSNNFDIIARPYRLSVDDITIQNDLKISLDLHSPRKIFVFEKDEANALALTGKIRETAEHVDIEHVIVDPAA